MGRKRYKIKNNPFSISVIITTYNRQHSIDRAIDSVLAQTNPPDEIILVDDGSNDQTAHLIKEKYPNIQYVWQENKGVSSARNTGLLHSRYDWIGFLDSDDEWLTTKLEAQIKALADQPSYKICHTNEIWIRNGKRVNPKKKHEKSGGFIFEKCLPLCIISPSSVLIHRTVFETYGAFDESLLACEDYDLWLRLCAFLPVLYLRKPQIIKYGGHRDQLSQKYWGMDRFRISALEKIINMNNLPVKNRIAAIKMLLKKIDIYIFGAKKRKKNYEIDTYQELRSTYRMKLNTLDS